MVSKANWIALRLSTENLSVSEDVRELVQRPMLPCWKWAEFSFLSEKTVVLPADKLIHTQIREELYVLYSVSHCRSTSALE